MKQLVHLIYLLLVTTSCSDNKPSNVQRILNELHHSTSQNVLVIAHRGDWRNAPENSIKAIENCIEMGVDIVEIDVRKTKDNQLVLMHDGTINRTTNGEGKVSDHTLEQLRSLFLKDKQGGENEKLTSHKIPTLEEALLAAKGKVLLNLDKAYGLWEDIVPVLQKTQTFDHVILKGGADAKTVINDIDFTKHPVHYLPILSSAKENAGKRINEHLELYSPVGFEFILNMHDSIMVHSDDIKNKGARVWVNTLWSSLCLGHTDEKALDDPDANWGWVINKGANMIQTDHPKELLQYLNDKGMRNF
jgi:glycerophosphoryl diester phosphodiesterase